MEPREGYATENSLFLYLNKNMLILLIILDDKKINIEFGPPLCNPPDVCLA
jgi:hypothetical protein